MTDDTPRTPAPGWYRDPALGTRLRWWDGRAWTGHVRERESSAPERGGTVPVQDDSARTVEVASVSAATIPVPSRSVVTVAPSTPLPVTQPGGVTAPVSVLPATVPPVAVPVEVPEAEHEVVSEQAPTVDADVVPLVTPDPEVADEGQEDAPQPSMEPVEVSSVLDVSEVLAPVVRPAEAADDPAAPARSENFALMAAATGALKVVAPAPHAAPPPVAAPEPPRRRLGLVIGLAAAALVTLAGIVFLVLDPLELFTPAPGYSDQVEEALAASIEAESGLGVTSVACPEGLAISQTAAFDCTVSFDDGSRLEITASIADGGQTVQWSPAV